MNFIYIVGGVWSWKEVVYGVCVVKIDRCVDDE